MTLVHENSLRKTGKGEKKWKKMVNKCKIKKGEFMQSLKIISIIDAGLHNSFQYFV